MLHYIYHVAFDARAKIKNVVVTEDKAMFEANFIGKHIGEFAGLAPTNKEVNVPVCVTYDLEDGLIKRARIYMLMDVMIETTGRVILFEPDFFKDSTCVGSFYCFCPTPAKSRKVFSFAFSSLEFSFRYQLRRSLGFSSICFALHSLQVVFFFQ
jgi:hypothetical protein